MILAFAFTIDTASWAMPDPLASCAEQRSFFETQLRPRPADRPYLWWIEETEPCPYGISLVGAQPPTGRFVGCEDGHGRRFGWRTEFGIDGKVSLQTRWDRNREIGPRVEWDPITYEIVRITALRDGRADGEQIEWLADGGVVVTSFKRGERDGATWRLDDRGHVMMVEAWRNNERNGRACTWRTEDAAEAAVEQVYAEGEPAAMF